MTRVFLRVNKCYLFILPQGHELGTGFDDRTLKEIGMKEFQNLFVSIDNTTNGANQRPLDTSEEMPWDVLLSSERFDRFFDLMNSVSKRRGNDTENAKSQAWTARIIWRAHFNVFLFTL